MEEGLVCKGELGAGGESSEANVAPPSLLHAKLKQDLPMAAILYKWLPVSKREKVRDLGLAAHCHGQGQPTEQSIPCTPSATLTNGTQDSDLSTALKLPQVMLEPHQRDRSILGEQEKPFPTEVICKRESSTERSQRGAGGTSEWRKRGSLLVRSPFPSGVCPSSLDLK